MTDQRQTFPMLPERWWWALRDRFKQTIPSSLSDSYLATVVGVKSNTVNKIALPALRKIGIVDSSGKVNQDFAIRWRDDAQYPSVCEDLLRTLYPQELLDAVPDPILDREAAERWFANKTGAGKSAVTKMVAFYQLLTKKDPSKTRSTKSKAPKSMSSSNARSYSSRDANVRRGVVKTGSKTINNSRTVLPRAEDHDQSPDNMPVSVPMNNETGSQSMPSLHIDIQIHISPEATPEQIDSIFKSMAKHIYNRRGNDE
ncbi:MAG: DUF5343 domain-containing protein [Roseiflexaceae bacterium]|nr:DUF5343 domain-containing protein [Roseiflexaceae bacterium]